MINQPQELIQTQQVEPLIDMSIPAPILDTQIPGNEMGNALPVFKPAATKAANTMFGSIPERGSTMIR